VLLLLLSLALQQPQVAVQVDRDEAVVGGIVSVTIVVSASGADPVTIEDPDLQGLELVDQRQQTRVSMQDGLPSRVTTRELSLRAIEAGTARIGPVRVRQGGRVAESAPIPIAVHALEATPTPELSPRVRGLLAGAVPPALQESDVGLTVLRSADSVLVGEQLDLAVVAWFPRDLRTQLRNPPTLSGPEVRGALTYSGPAPTAAAANRLVNGQWYDLFVLPEVVFPLIAGTLEIGEATVSFSVPLSGSFLSRELRREARSSRTGVWVSALPSVEGGTPFAGAIGRELQMSLDASSTELRRGDAVHLRVEVSGFGDVSFWPEPALDWPVGLRAYLQEVFINVAPEEGVVGGSKAYDYLVVADSTGTHRLPPIRYTYFDTERGRYVDVVGTALHFIAPPAGGSSTRPVRAAQPLMVESRVHLPAWLRSRGSWWSWIVVFVLPPLSAAFGRRRWRRSRRSGRRRRRSGAAMSPLAELDAAYTSVLAHLAPHTESLSGAGLADALRAARVDPSLASHAARVRERLRQARYGPEGGTDADELAAEVQEVLKALAGGQAVAVASRVVATVIILVSAGAVGAVAQTPEQLYEAGAVRIAADSFAARAARQPLVAAHWYNLGSAFDYLGDPARAQAAWMRAARLAPREPAIRRVLAAHPSPDRASDRLMWISPVTPGEALLGAAGCWILAWVLFTMRKRRRYAIALLVVAAALGAYGGSVERLYGAPTALVVRSQTPLREAPYGGARARVELDEAAAVRVEREWGVWRLVTHGNAQGWLLVSEVTEI